MTESEPERCAMCRFWKQDTSGNHDDLGQCVRFPPVIMEHPRAAGIDATYVTTDFPVTDATEWCGEFCDKRGYAEGDLGRSE